MSLVNLPNGDAKFATGQPAYGTDITGNVNTLVADYNGNITNANISASAAIADSKLAQIATAGKVNVTAITGVLPAANGGTASTTGNVGTITIILDGGGETLTADATAACKAYLHIPFACTIQSVTMLADVSGSAIVDIWKTTYTLFDSGANHPVAGDKITASAPPTISTATKSQDATLTGWSTGVNISADDVLGFHITSATTITKITLSLKIVRA